MLFKQAIESIINVWRVSQFETIGYIRIHKTTCRRDLILVDLIKTTFLRKYFLHIVIIRFIDPKCKICHIQSFLLKTLTDAIGLLL